MKLEKHIHLNQTVSTNSYMKELLLAGVDLPELTLVETEFQTCGRGQVGNSWESQAGENLLFSILCHPDGVKADHQFVLSQAIALTVQQTLLQYVDDVRVKWPNDIYWQDKKICGILIECTLQGSTVNDCIIGVGLNVNQTAFESDAPNPVSLAQIVNLTFNRKAVLDAIIENFIKYYDRILHGEDISYEYKQNLYRRNGWYKYEEPNGDMFEAKIVDVLPSGHIVLMDKNEKIREYEFKEVKFVI